jgi:hypothetical protein
MEIGNNTGLWPPDISKAVIPTVAGLSRILQSCVFLEILWLILPSVIGVLLLLRAAILIQGSANAASCCGLAL